MVRARFSFLAFIFLASCASYTDETNAIRSAYMGGQYEDALKKIDDSVLESQDRNRLLFLLEKAMILDRLKRLEKSRHNLFDGDKLADKLYTTSISKEALTYIYNESAQDYAGEDYERVAIHSILALSFLEQKSLNEARVEARKINTKLAEINSHYEDKKNRYRDDAFANYLAGIIYEAKGEYDAAIIDYNKAFRVYKDSYSEYFNTIAPTNLIESLYRLALLRNRDNVIKTLERQYSSICANVKKNLAKSRGQGELIVIHEYGTIAPKVAQEFYFPVKGQVVRVSYPTVQPKSHGGETGLSIDDMWIPGELVQDMDRIAKETLADKRARLIVKQTARLISKGVATEAAYQNFGPLGGLAANVYSAVTETADTRSWTLLPSAFFITRKRLDPGQYKVRLKTQNRLSQIVEIKIEPNKVVILRDVG